MEKRHEAYVYEPSSSNLIIKSKVHVRLNGVPVSKITIKLTET